MRKAPVDTIDHCSDSQLTHLLELALSDEGKQRRSRTAPRGGAFATLARLLTEIGAASGQPVEAVLTVASDQDASLDSLRQTKETAKRLALAAPTPAHRSAALLVYHLAVATALTRHGVNISSRPPGSRLLLYGTMVERLAEDPLAAVFREAVAKIKKGQAHAGR